MLKHLLEEARRIIPKLRDEALDRTPTWQAGKAEEARNRVPKTFTNSLEEGHVGLAEEIGIIQSLVSNYESGRLRLHAEMLTRIALPLEVSADELLGLKKSKEEKALKRKFLRRLKLTGRLSKREQEY